MAIITRIMNWFRRTFIMGKRPPLVMSPEVEARLIEAYGKSSPDKRLSLAHWDGLHPPPAAIRCPSTQREQLDPDTSRVTGCMLLDGHDGRCVFAE